MRLEAAATRHLRDITAPSVLSSYRNYYDECEQAGAPAVSLETFRRACMQDSLLTGTQARAGSRAAHAVAPPSSSPALPRDGERAFEIAHIDSTVLDDRVISSVSGKPLPRLYITVLQDAYSKVVLAHHVSFNSPGAASTLAVLKACIREHRRLPDALVVDQGAEFNFTELAELCVAVRMQRIERPTSRPRFGASIESFFNSLNAGLIHQLPGNTKLLRLLRGLSASHHPDRHATFTFAQIVCILEFWLYDVYPGSGQLGLGACPRDVFGESLRRSGDREVRVIRLSPELDVLFSLGVRGGTRSVHPTRGVIFRYLRYWHDVFGTIGTAGSSVPTRYDAFSPLVLYCFVGDRWVHR